MDRPIGIREAKGRLSEVLRDVRRGGRWIITEHGRPVAQVGPMEAPAFTLADRVGRLEERGVIEPLDHTVQPLPPPLPLEKGLAAKWLREDREHGR